MFVRPFKSSFKFLRGASAWITPGVILGFYFKIRGKEQTSICTVLLQCCGHRSLTMTEGWTLQIRPEPPASMFAGHHYTSHVYLLDSANQLVTGVTFGLNVRLLHEDESVASDRIMHLNSRNLSINKQGNAQFSYYFAETSLLHGNKRFKLRVGGKGSHAFLPPAISTPIRVIRHQLQVCNSLPTEWFKDQGGRDKHMNLEVQLQDFTRQPVAIPDNIPLVVSLVYEKTGAQSHPIYISLWVDMACSLYGNPWKCLVRDHILVIFVT